MAAVNYYLGLKRGDGIGEEKVQAGTATVGTAVDVEVRLQTNDGSADTGLTRLEAATRLRQIAQYIEDGGLNGAGTYLPVL